MKHLFSILFIFYFVFGQSQTTIPIVGFKGTINTFPTVSNDTITTTVTLLDISNQFTGNNLTGRDSLVLWKNCKRYRVDTIMTAFATSVTLKLLKEGNPNLTPGVCAFIEETVGNKSFAPAGITDGERQCINAYYAGNDSLSILDTIFINDCLYYVLNGDTINAGYVNTIPTKVKDTPTMKLRIVSDTIRADIKKRLNSGNVGGIDKWSYIEFDSTGQITLASTTLNDDFDKDPYNEFQNLVIDSVGRRFTLGITDGNEVSFVDQVGITDTTYINQLISDSIAAIVFPRDSLYTNGDPGHISIIGGNEVDINVNDADSNPTNEIQTLSFSMPNLSIGGGNTVNLTGLINDADSNPYNELQTISIIDSTDRVFQIRLHPENQVISFRDSVGLTEMDTSLISQIISDSLSTYVFETDTSLINQLISDSLATINQDQIVSLTGAGITNVTGTYPNFTITSTEVDGNTTNEIQTLSQSFTGSTEATYSLNLSGGSVKDTTGFMRLETMFSTAGSRTYRYKSNLGAIMGITEDPTLSGNSNIEVLRTGNQLTWGLRKDNASNGQIYKYNGTSWALSSDVSGISSLNGLTPSTQTFVTGTTGTSFNIASSGSTHTFNLPTVSATATGVVDPFTRGYWNTKLDGSGATNKVAYWTPSGGTWILNNNTNFHFDPSSIRLGIGNASPSVTLHVQGSGYTDHLRVQGSGGGSGMSFNGGTNTEYLWYQDANQIFSFGGGGPSGSNKKLHVDGGVSIGASYDATSITSANGLIVQGNLGVGGNNATDHDAVFNGTNAVKISSGTTAQRPASPMVGSLRLNESTVRFEYYYPSSWYQILSTSTNLTQGSVLFADVNGNPTQDNGNLFWNDTNNRLGIGTSSPTTPLHVLGGANAATMQYNAFASPLRVYNSASVGTGLRFEDSSGASDIYYNNGTYSIGGGGSAVTNKKAHIDGGTTIGANYDGTSIDANSLKVEGSVTVNTRTGTGTSVAMYDASGKLCTAGLTGLTISGGNLVGAAPLSGTTGAIPYFTSTTALGSTPFTYNSNIMTIPTGNSIYFPGTATIIDKNASGGSAGEFLSRAASGGGMDWVAAPETDISTFTKSGTDIPIISSTGSGFTLRDGTNISNTELGGTLLTINTDISYGYMRTSSSTISLTTSLQKIAVSSPLNNGVITASDANDRFTVSQTGVYEIIYDIDYSYDQNTLIEFNVYKNGAALINQCDGRTTQSDLNNSHNISKGAIVQLNASDYIELFTKSGVSCTGTFYNINFSIKRID